jgi:cyclase
VYVETRYRSGNVGFVCTGVGIVCIDVPLMPDDVYHWLGCVRSTADEPILFVVQTDYDRRRIASTRLFHAPVIAHNAATDQMKKIYSREKEVQRIKDLLGYDSQEGNWRVRMPDITFTEQLILVKGSREIHLVHGGGHSPATCMVHLPQERLIFAGDVVFNNVHPHMEFAETKAWLYALNRLRKMPVDVIVPGHGPVCDREATYPLSGYIRDMRASVRHSYRERRSKSDTSKAVIPEFLDAFPASDGDREYVYQCVKGGSDRIYDEYRAADKRRKKNKQKVT